MNQAQLSLTILAFRSLPAKIPRPLKFLIGQFLFELTPDTIAHLRIVIGTPLQRPPHHIVRRVCDYLRQIERAYSSGVAACL
jgi:hypothetical protein